MRVREETASSFYQLRGKRLLDVILSLILIIVTSPIIVIAALAILITNGRPIFFTQERVGLNGESFTIIKFRTMKKCKAVKEVNIAAADGVPEDFYFKSGKDNRVTKVGKLLRKCSIDELPQLFNVFIGSMSIVGPRPEVPSITNLYNDFQKQRLNVKPGITGLAQVNGRSLISHGKKIELDLKYIEKQSFLLDLKILFLTFIIVITTKGAF